jgi:hypothetical protein
LRTWRSRCASSRATRRKGVSSDLPRKWRQVPGGENGTCRHFVGVAGVRPPAGRKSANRAGAGIAPSFLSALLSARPKVCRSEFLGRRGSGSPSNTGIYVVTGRAYPLTVRPAPGGGSHPPKKSSLQPDPGEPIVGQAHAEFLLQPARGLEAGSDRLHRGGLWTKRQTRTKTCSS